jgi:AcrR family transcriptional regulator
MAVEQTKRPTMRDIKAQFRMEQHREFLATALRIVTADGLTALTMQGLAEELGCGIRTLYLHFPSKMALVAELQRESLDIVNTSFRLSRAHLDELLVERRVRRGAQVGLARVWGAARFWIEAEAVFPQEIDLCRRMFIDPTLRLDDAEAPRVVPAALRMLDTVREMLDDAVAARALEEGNPLRRAVVLIAATTGVLMTSGLGRWDEELFVGPPLSTELLHDLLRGWGATKANLAIVAGHVDELAARGLLVPPVRG